MSARKPRMLPAFGDRAAADSFREMAEHAPGPLWIFRPDGGIASVNARLMEYSGLREAELRDLGWQSIVHAQDLPYSIRRWREGVARGEPYEVQFRLRRHDGQYRWHLVQTRPVRDADGRIRRWIGSATDIEDQLQAARVLASRSGEEEVANRLRSIMTLSSDFYWETDAEHRFTALELGGRFAATMFVASRIGKTRWEVPSVLPDAAGWREHRAVLRARRPFRDFETARRGDDGTVHHYSVDGEPVFDARGRFSGYRGVGREITARKLAEQAFRQAGDRLRAFFDCMPAVAWIKDARLRYVWISESYQRLLGKAPAEVIGRVNDEVWPAELAQRHHRIDEGVLRDKRPVQAVTRVPLPGGGVARMLVVKFPLPDETGALGVAGIGFEAGPDEATGAVVDDPLERLSDRELQVLRLIVDGHTSAEVAAQLSLSPKSVDTYRSRLMAKLQVEDLPNLVKYAIRHGLTTIG